MNCQQCTIQELILTESLFLAQIQLTHFAKRGRQIPEQMDQMHEAADLTFRLLFTG